MPNRLISEQSPYLLQHAHNPVDWYPWGDAAFKRAEAEHKPVLVSIGYAACHWCHVMERESFENEAVAAYMNEHFICIKVDREEHPDVDHLYMDAVQAISGSGGWPLNVFVTPGRIPFYGGTYFPPRPAYNRPSWPQLLERMNAVWTEQQEEVVAQGDQMIQYLQQASRGGMGSDVQAWDMETCRAMADNLLKQADTVYGGFGGAPKFPGTMAISFLLEHYHFTGHEPALRQALLSLDKMIDGGIYDQVGGGFARYATDKEWLVPHFEKMLYDNALLVCTLCDAYCISQDERYRVVIEETIDFVERELKDPSGLYYSALDADSEGVEGKFYTWTWEEWQDAFGQPDPAVAAYFGLSEAGNWEGVNILHVPVPVETVARDYNITAKELAEKVKDAKAILAAKRAERIRPLTDDKSLLSWNALMNIALSKTATALGEEHYLRRAEAHANKMLALFEHGGELMHTWKKDVARINAKLDDYAYLVQALLQIVNAGGDRHFIHDADRLMEHVSNNFISDDGNFFYYTSVQQQDIPVRKIDMYDGAVPSANAVMAQNLLQSGLLMERSDRIEQASYMLGRMLATTVRYTYSFSYWAQLAQRSAKGMRVVIIAMKETTEARKGLQKQFVPQCFILNSEKEISDIPILKNKFFEDKGVIFVCTEHACLPPTGDIEGALKLIS